MKNITLLALGIFIGAVGIVYILGPIYADKNPNKTDSFVAINEETPSPDIMEPSSEPTPFTASSPVPSFRPTPIPTLSGKPSPVSSPVASAVPTVPITASPIPTPKPSPVPTPSKPALTKSEVAKHSIKNDCYIIVNNKVYNISSYFGSHPGGDSIMLSNCGKETSVVFSAIHSNSAWDLLSKYLIGNLVAG